MKSAGEEGYPSQKGELEAVRDIYGDYDLQEEDEKSLEACENLEEDLLEAVVELAGERVEAAGRSTISLPGEWNWPSRRNKTMKLRLLAVIMLLQALFSLLKTNLQRAS